MSSRLRKAVILFGPDPSEASPIRQPSLELPSTHAWTSGVTVQVMQPGVPGVVAVSVNEASAAGWLFHVIVDSDQLAVTRNAS